MRPFLINLILALIWMLLSRHGNIFNFALGFAIGFVLLALFPGLFSSQNYVRRSFNFIRFIFIFLLAFLKANLSVAAIILFVPKSRISPSLFTYDVSDLNHLEILLLSHCITLTPGTITVDVAEDRSELTIHCLDYRKPQEVHDSITKILKNPITRFTR